MGTEWKETLRQLGLPLSGDDVILASPVAWEAVAELVDLVLLNGLEERDAVALGAWLLALRDHFSTVYTQSFLRPRIQSFLANLPVDGKVIKLRRIAIANLARVA